MMSTEPVMSGSLMVARMYWMFFGPAVLFILTSQIVERKDGWWNLLDGLYLAGLLSILLARWYEFHAGQPLDSFGEPAPPEELRRFCVRALLIGAAVWVGVKLLAQSGWL